MLYTPLRHRPLPNPINPNVAPCPAPCNNTGIKNFTGPYLFRYPHYKRHNHRRKVEKRPLMIRQMHATSLYPVCRCCTIGIVLDAVRISSLSQNCYQDQDNPYLKPVVTEPSHPLSADNAPPNLKVKVICKLASPGIVMIPKRDAVSGCPAVNILTGGSSYPPYLSHYIWCRKF